MAKLLNVKIHYLIVPEKSYHCPQLWIHLGPIGALGAAAARPVEQDFIQDPGNVTHLLLLMEAKNAKELTRK